VVFSGSFDEVQEYFDRALWSDGLPIVPPTQPRVEAMLAQTTFPRQHLVARIAPGFGAATVERIAINAVMAGCRPEYLPVLIAAVAAVEAPAFNLQGIQATTNPVSVWMIVNGPIARRLEVNAGPNCLGQGSPANVTLGRALRLILQNVGGALPGDMDRATHGQPGKIAFCCAENEADSPWLPLHVERGFDPQASTVTVVGASGTLNMNTHAKDAADLVRVLADSMSFAPSNDYWLGGEPWLIIAPEHAEVLQRDGVDKPELRRRLWEQSKMRAGRMALKDFERTRNSRRAELGEIGPDTLLPVSTRPEEIGIVVAGGPGTHSIYVPSFGDTRSVTRAIEA
jgi:hypothetical protein